MAPGGGKVFGQTLSKGRGGASRYQCQFGGGRKNTVYRLAADADDKDNDAQQAARLAAEKRRQRQAMGQELDHKLGFERFALTGSHEHEQEAAVAAASSHAHQADGKMDEHHHGDNMERRGWLFQMLPTTVSGDHAVMMMMR